MQEIGLIGSVAVGASKHHPVGAAGSAHLHVGGSELGKERASSATIPRRCASHQVLIHGLAIACLNGRIDLRSDLGLEDRATIICITAMFCGLYAKQALVPGWQQGGCSAAGPAPPYLTLPYLSERHSLPCWRTIACKFLMYRFCRTRHDTPINKGTFHELGKH